MRSKSHIFKNGVNGLRMSKLIMERCFEEHFMPFCLIRSLGQLRVYFISKMKTSNTYISETARATGLGFWVYTKLPGVQMKSRSQGHSKVMGSYCGKYPNQTVNETRGHVRSLDQVR